MRYFSIYIIIFFLVSCGDSNNLNRFDEDFLINHKACLEKLVDLPNESSFAKDKVTGHFTDQFVIGNGSNNFVSQARYGTRFITTTDNTAGGEVTLLSKTISLLFWNSSNQHGIGLDIDFTNTEAVTRINELFEGKSILELSTNHEENDAQIFIEKSCNNKSYLVSSLYSSKESQQLIIDEFKSSIRNDSINYVLKFHASDLEIASRQFNDSDVPEVIEWRGDYDPVFDLTIDTFHITFSIPQ